MTDRASPPIGWRAAVLVTVGVWALIYLPGLGSQGFTDTEAHRAVPALELLAKSESGLRDWLAPTMFDRVYLRKPPGMAWLGAGSAWVFGPSEFSIRLISALSVLLGAIASGWYSSRWFGSKGFLPGSLAVVLMPAMWLYGRSAELEAPMFAGTLLASLGLLDLIAARSRANLSLLITGAGMLILQFIKGPAGLPAVGAAMVAGALVTRSARGAISWRVLAAIASTLLLFGGWMLWVSGQSLGGNAITQSPSDFMWSIGKLGDWLALAPMALLAGLPMTLSLLFPWGPDAATEPIAEDELARRMSRALAWATLGSIGLLLAAGISNPRYALPALVFAPALVGWVVSGRDRMTPKRARIANWCMLGGPRFAVGLLAGAGIAFAVMAQPELRNESGREAGREIAALVPEGSVVAADHAVEARPEILLEVARSGSAAIWLPEDAWPSDAFLLVRDDEGSNELSKHQKTRATLGRWRVHEYQVVLLAPEG